MSKLKLTAVEQVSDSALIDEVNRRLKAGLIDQDALAVVQATDTVEESYADMHLDDEFIEADCLGEAAARYARGDYPETLWNLEKALGPKFSGLGDLILGRA